MLWYFFNSSRGSRIGYEYVSQLVVGLCLVVEPEGEAVLLLMIAGDWS